MEAGGGHVVWIVLKVAPSLRRRRRLFASSVQPAASGRPHVLNLNLVLRARACRRSNSLTPRPVSDPDSGLYIMVRLGPRMA
eukprot:SAG22_NODE_245_length_13962_cov_11.954555_6_plen_82_part_00